LLITRSDDPSVISVADALLRRGAIPVRLDTDLFPTDVRLSVRQGPSSTRAVLHSPEGEINLNDVSAVWYRRFAPGHALPSDMDMRSAATKESRAALAGLIEILPAFHLDEVRNVRRADNKPLQLKWAAEEGLRVPRTLVTNDEDAVRRFASECVDGLVAKTLSSFVVDRDDDELAVYTTLVRDEDLQDLSGLRLSPMQFQEVVPKAFDLRCTVVGTAVFTAVLDAPLLEDGCVDWRIQGYALADAWQPHVLPAHVEKALLALLDRFGLNYGAIDMVLTPDGEYVFLEVNPAGEFLWLDGLGGRSISDALAGVLTTTGRRV
jgi:glutathione synthase/RimK-type ligase-like ATP-grasp enzyme